MNPMKKPQLSGYYTEQEEADRLGLGLVTLGRWRRQGLGPKATKVGRRVIYAHDAEAKWLAEQGEQRRTPPKRGRPRSASARNESPPLAAAALDR